MDDDTHQHLFHPDRMFESAGVYPMYVHVRSYITSVGLHTGAVCLFCPDSGGAAFPELCRSPAGLGHYNMNGNTLQQKTVLAVYF
jgi:hypothetical protein